jgi:hypothetical protein
VAVGLVRATGVPRSRDHERRLASLEDALAENARLAVLLEQHVARIEQSLVPLLRDERPEHPGEPG